MRFNSVQTFLNEDGNCTDGRNILCSSLDSDARPDHVWDEDNFSNSFMPILFSLFFFASKLMMIIVINKLRSNLSAFEPKWPHHFSQYIYLLCKNAILFPFSNLLFVFIVWLRMLGDRNSILSCRTVAIISLTFLCFGICWVKWALWLEPSRLLR